MNKQEATTKMQIVDKAVELFKKEGFTNVSVNKICKSIGITRSAFYYYFRTKDEIFDYYLLVPELYISEHILPFLDAANYRSKFLMIFELFSKRIVEVGPEVVGWVLKRNIDANVKNAAPHDITMWKVYVDLIRKAQENGEVSRKLDAESTVEAIVYMVDGIGMDWCNKKGNFDYTEKCRRMIEYFL